MHNNYFFLRKLSEELNQLLTGQELLTCFSQEKDEVVLGFSNEHYIKCILKSDFSALQILYDFSRARKNSVSLWQELYGLKVKEISVFKNERAIRIELENNVVLVIKLFGNRPNLLVYKSEVFSAMFNNKLLTDKNLSLPDFNRELEVSKEDFAAENYKKMFFTFGKDVFARLEKSDTAWEDIQDMIAYLETPKYYVTEKEGLPKVSLFEGEEFPNTISALNAFVIKNQKVNGTERLKFELKKKLSKEIEKTESYISNVEQKLKQLKTGTKNEEIGNIIMANIHAIPAESTEVKLHNFYNDTYIKIKLKKDLSPQKNAESYYRKSKNEKIEIETLERNFGLAQEKLRKLKDDFEKVESTNPIKELRSLSKGILNTQNKTTPNELPFLEFEFRGVKIWVGRNAKNNDLLTTQYAHKDDYWLHAKDVPGSHVVIKNSQPANEVLEYAASLAAYYSKRKTDSLVTVLYTPKKYVRKAKNLAAGQVIVEREKTLLVEPAKVKLSNF